MLYFYLSLKLRLRHFDVRERNVEKAVSTKMLTATSWSGWSGYKDFNVKMTLVDKYTRQTEQFHTPTATQVLISLALLRVKEVTTKGSTDLHANIRKLHIYEHLPTAIHYWDEYRNRIICFDVAYVKTAEDKKKDEGDRKKEEEQQKHKDEDTEMPDVSEMDTLTSLTLSLKRFAKPNWAPLTRDLHIEVGKYMY
ncbi:hypothetical protein ACHAPV_003969 [Trichoderma viride]